jgi:hypothetical protein
VVAGLTAAAAAIPVVSSALPASTDPIDPARLRDLILKSMDLPHQGYAESVGRLAVPELPKLASVTALLSGTTRIRTWVKTRDRYRFDVLNTANEHDVSRVGEFEYVWDYGENTLTEVEADVPVRLPRAGDLLPPDLARRILAAAPGDALRGIPARRVAGISAAGLRLEPGDPDTTIAHVDIWADPSGLPLQVEVTAKNVATPVIMTRFLEVSLGPPEDFSRQIGPDAGFRTATTPDIAPVLASLGLTAPPPRLAGRDVRTDSFGGLAGLGLYGSGLSTFVVLQLPRDVGNSVVDAATKAGAQQVNNVVRLEIPPLTLAVVRAPRRRIYLLAGLVSGRVLDEAGADLSMVNR